MNWRVGGPLATAAAMLAAAWGGIAEAGQDEALSALFFGVASILLGVLLTQIIVQWWRDATSDDDGAPPDGPDAGA